MHWVYFNRWYSKLNVVVEPWCGHQLHVIMCLLKYPVKNTHIHIIAIMWPNPEMGCKWGAPFSPPPTKRPLPLSWGVSIRFYEYVDLWISKITRFKRFESVSKIPGCRGTGSGWWMSAHNFQQQNFTKCFYFQLDPSRFSLSNLPFDIGEQLTSNFARFWWPRI
jgi:hypothetical protein